MMMDTEQPKPNPTFYMLRPLPQPTIHIYGVYLTLNCAQFRVQLES